MARKRVWVAVPARLLDDDAYLDLSPAAKLALLHLHFGCDRWGRGPAGRHTLARVIGADVDAGAAFADLQRAGFVATFTATDGQRCYQIADYDDTAPSAIIRRRSASVYVRAESAPRPPSPPKGVHKDNGTRPNADPLPTDAAPNARIGQPKADTIPPIPAPNRASALRREIRDLRSKTGKCVSGAPLGGEQDACQVAHKKTESSVGGSGAGSSGGSLGESSAGGGVIDNPESSQQAPPPLTRAALELCERIAAARRKHGGVLSCDTTAADVAADPMLAGLASLAAKPGFCDCARKLPDRVIGRGIGRGVLAYLETAVGNYTPPKTATSQEHLSTGNHASAEAYAAEYGHWPPNHASAGGNPPKANPDSALPADASLLRVVSS